MPTTVGKLEAASIFCENGVEAEDSVCRQVLDGRAMDKHETVHFCSVKRLETCPQKGVILK